MRRPENLFHKSENLPVPHYRFSHESMGKADERKIQNADRKIFSLGVFARKQKTTPNSTFL